MQAEAVRNEHAISSMNVWDGLVGKKVAAFFEPE